MLAVAACGAITAWSCIDAPPVFAADVTAAAGFEQNDEGKLLQLVGFLRQDGLFDDARKLAEKGLAIAEKRFGPDNVHVARWLTQLGLTYRAEGRYTAAEPHLKRALAIYEKAAGPDAAEAGESMGDLGGLYADEGRLAEAEPLLKRALAIAEKTRGPEHGGTATALTNLGVLYISQGRLTEAEPLLKRALAIDEKTNGPEHPDTSASLNNLAELYREQSRFADAEPLYRRSLAIDEKNLGPDHPILAATLGNLALLCQRQERYAEAETLFRRALDIQDRKLGDHPSTATTLGNFASMLTEQGRFGEAEPLLVRALAISEKTLGPDNPDTALSLNNLAALYRTQGKRAEALPLYARALAIFEKALGPDHPLTGMALNNLAEIHRDDGRYDQAEAMFKRSAAIAEKRLPPDHPDRIATLANLAGVYLMAGKPAAAEPLFKNALAAVERNLPKDHPQIGMANAWLARTLLEQKKYEEALPVAERASAIIAKLNARTVAQQLQGGWRVEFNHDVVFTIQARIAYALSRKKPNDENALRAGAFEILQHVGFDDTGRSLANMASRFAAGTGGLARLLREQQDLLRRLPVLDKRLANALGSSDPATRAQAAPLRAEAEAVGARLADIDATLRRDHPAYGDLADPKPIGVAETQNLLQPGEAVVLLLPVEEASFLFAVSKTKIAWAVAPAGNSELTKQVAALRRQLDPNLWNARPLEPFDRAAAHRLYRELLMPLEDVLAGKTQVFVVPSGPLTGLPLSVLVTEAPKGGAAGDADAQALRDTAWLIKRHALITLPSVSSLKALRLYANKSSGSEPFAGFGDPSFDAVTVASAPVHGPDVVRLSQPNRATDITPTPALAPSSPTVTVGIERQRNTPHLSRPDHQRTMPVTFVNAASSTEASSGSVASVFRGSAPDPSKLRRLAPLPATARELRAIAKALGASETADVFLRERATEAQIKTLDLSKKRVIAFATHSLMAGDMGLGEPGLVFTPPGAPSERDDGYLSASEVARLDLRADWIILSACNTAAGDTPGAKGLSGLARAFFLAGSKSLLVSHWPVWDTAAMKLTTGAVANMQKNPADGRAEALRQSMLALMNDKSAAYFAHPAAWAPFVVVGETRAN